MSAIDDGVTKIGRDLIRDWASAKERVERLREQINRAEAEAANAEIVLARWMLPPDATKGEVISIWFGDSLLQVTADESCSNSHRPGSIRWRSCGPKLSEYMR